MSVVFSIFIDTRRLVITIQTIQEITTLCFDQNILARKANLPQFDRDLQKEKVNFNACYLHSFICYKRKVLFIFGTISSNFSQKYFLPFRPVFYINKDNNLAVLLIAEKYYIQRVSSISSTIVLYIFHVCTISTQKL